MDKIFPPPRFPEEEKTRSASLLHSILIIMIAVTTLAQAAFISIDPGHTSRYIVVVVVIDISGIILLALNRAGHVRKASYALILLAWGTITVLAATSGGIQAPEATAYFMVVFASGFLLGEIIGVLCGLVCILTGLGLEVAGVAGLLPPSAVQQSGFTIWLIYAIFIVIIIGLQTLATRSIHQSYQQAQQELTDRRLIEAALKESEERFQLVLRYSPVFMYITDQDLRYKWVNNPPPGLFSDDLLGKRDDQVWESGEVQELMDFKQTVLDSGMGGRRVFQIGDEDRMVSYDISAEPFKNAAGEVIGLMVASVDITERKQFEENQTQAQAQLVTHRLLIENQEAERVRIARDLHDGPVQALVADLFTLQAVLPDIEVPEVLQAVDAVRQDLQDQIGSLREYAGELRPPALVKFGLEKAIRSHLESLQEKYPSMSMHLEAVQEDPLLSEELRLPLFRIYQEAVNNILRHAQATKVTVRFSRDDKSVRLEIIDNGIGFEPPAAWLDLARQGHLGLVGVRERAEAIGGKVDIISNPGGGTCLRVVAPLSRENQDSK